MNHEEEVLKVVKQITAALEMVHKNQQKQLEFNQMVIKGMNVADQQLELLQVAVGELKKEVRHVVS